MDKQNNIKLHHGDCLDKMRTIPDGSIDMILADPPYGVTANKWDSAIPLEPMWKHLKRIIKPHGAIVMTATQPFTTILIHSNRGMFKYCWVWIKSQAVGHLNAYRMPMRNTEDICVFYGHPPTYNPQVKDKPEGNIRADRKPGRKGSCYGDHAGQGNRRIRDDQTIPMQTIRFNNCQERLHPTQKPVDLMAYMIKTYTTEGETVLDFAMGSGTTGVAAMQLDRKFIGIELDKTYFDIAVNRIKKLDIPP